MANTGLLAGIVVVIIIIVAAFVLFGNNTVPTTTTIASGTTQPTTTISSSTATQTTPVLLTDPLYAPANASAVVITYSHVMVQTTGPNGGWASATGSGSGSVDLSSISSTGQVMGYATVAQNSSIDAVSFVITSANVTVNGHTYQMSVPNSTVTAQVAGNTGVGIYDGVLVDITPTVYAMFSQNTTSYTMGQASGAVVVSGATTSLAGGTSIMLSGTTQAQLQSQASRIAITSANVSTSNNSTMVSVTVQDNSNQSIVLNNVLVYGPQSVVANASGGISVIGVTINASLLANLTTQIGSVQALNFIVSSNGSMQIPGSAASVSSAGYVIAPYSSTKLTFSGQVVYDGAVTAVPKPGSQYTVAVTGNGNAQASTSVVASSS